MTLGTTLARVIRVCQDEAREVCGIPDGVEIAALVPLGRPRGRFAVAAREPAQALGHRNRSGRRREGMA
jgi:hypothetical protein